MCLFSRFVLIAVVTCCAFTSEAMPQNVILGNYFTYQGLLKSNGSPFDGNANIVIRCYDQSIGGNLLSSNTFPVTAVVNGVFTVQLDYGSAIFTGFKRWLEIQVNGTTLAPRQEVVPAPYAHHARTVGSLSGSYAGQVLLTNPLNQFTGSGAGITGLSAANISTGNLGSSRMPVGGSWSLSSNLNVDNNTLFINPTSNRIGIGTSTPTHNLTIQSTDQNTLRLIGPLGGTTGWGGRLNFGDNNIVHLEEDQDDRLRYQAARHGFTGMVGIGTLDPTHSLTVQSFDTNTLRLIGPSGSVGSGARLSFGDDNIVHIEENTDDRMKLQAGVFAVMGGPLGIGLLEPSHSLTVQSGDIRTIRLIGPNSLGHGARMNFGDADYVFLEEDLDDRLTIQAIRTAMMGGNVGIGTLTPLYQLELSTNSAAKPTSGAWTISSDERLKKNINTIEGALGDLLSLRGVTYQWREPETQGNMDGTYTGLIAQDVERVFPNWISEGLDGYKALTVIGFEGIVVEALRELRAEKDAQISELREANQVLIERVEAMTHQYEELAGRIERLEAGPMNQ